VDVQEAIKGRRSVRSFIKKSVSSKLVEELIAAACMAPSAGNIQPWEFVVVRKEEIKKKLAEAALGQSFVEDAPVVIAVCANQERSSQRYNLRGKTLYCIQDTAAATQNILLAAYSYGLGTCWIGAFEEDQVRAVLKIPPRTRPVAIVPVGYPAESTSLRRKRPISEIVHYETY
jgi:nitroreductase